MIEILDTTPANLLQVKIIDEATSIDTNRLKPLLKKHAAEHDDPRILFFLTGLQRWNQVVNLWTELNMNSDQVNKFSRIALIGKESWMGWLTTAIERMVDTDLKFFGDSQTEDAIKWVEQ